MQDFATIARRVEWKRAAAALALSTSSLRIAGGVATYSGPGSFMNRACALGFDAPVENGDVEVLVQFFESRGETARIEVCPFAHTSLIHALGANGFVLQEFGNVLAMPLATLTVDQAAAPDGVTIERIDGSDPQSARAFAEKAERNFAKDQDPVSHSAIDLIMRSLRDSTNDSFVARTREGEIVGTASSDSTDGLTMLFGAAVTPAWRGRGVHRALMLARLANAARRGSDLACVIGAPGLATERTAARLGFVMAYTRAELARLPASANAGPPPSDESETPATPAIDAGTARPARGALKDAPRMFRRILEHRIG